jgi:hypothetical protein
VEIRRLAVVAATYAQYSEWCHEHRVSPRNRRLQYVDDLVKLRGMRPMHYVWIGRPVHRRQEVTDELHAYLQQLGTEVDDPELAAFVASITEPAAA